MRVPEVSDLGVSDPGEQVVPDQPAGSNVVLNCQDQDLTLKVPPAGLLKGSKGMFVFSLIWLGFMAVFTPMWFLSDTAPGGTEALGLLAFLSLFWAIGGGLLVASIHMGRRRAIIDVVGGVLLISRAGLFGTKQVEFETGQVRAVRVGASGLKVNNVPVMELQILPVEGRKVGLLSQRNDDELEWIAATLRTAIQVGR